MRRKKEVLSKGSGNNVLQGVPLGLPDISDLTKTKKKSVVKSIEVAITYELLLAEEKKSVAKKKKKRVQRRYSCWCLDKTCTAPDNGDNVVPHPNGRYNATGKRIR